MVLSVRTREADNFQARTVSMVEVAHDACVRISSAQATARSDLANLLGHAGF
jgi:hypothetical protein